MKPRIGKYVWKNAVYKVAVLSNIYPTVDMVKATRTVGRGPNLSYTGLARSVVPLSVEPQPPINSTGI